MNGCWFLPILTPVWHRFFRWMKRTNILTTNLGDLSECEKPAAISLKRPVSNPVRLLARSTLIPSLWVSVRISIRRLYSIMDSTRNRCSKVLATPTMNLNLWSRTELWYLIPEVHSHCGNLDYYARVLVFSFSFFICSSDLIRVVIEFHKKQRW